MTDRRLLKALREKAIYELATAIAEAQVDAWLDGELTGDGLDIPNDKGCQHETADKAGARPKRDKRPKAAAGMPNVRRSPR